LIIIILIKYQITTILSIKHIFANKIDDLI